MKLGEDALKITFIEALEKAGIPVYLPYGNDDTYHGGERRDINLLSVSKGARAYTGVERKGELLPDFPFSPLLAGVGLVIFELIECPDAGDPPSLTLMWRVTEPAVSVTGVQILLPNSMIVATCSMLLRLQLKKLYVQLLNTMQEVTNPLQLIQGSSPLVVTDRQYASLAAVCGNCLPWLDDKQLVWLNSKRYGEPYSLNPQCRKRGTINGSSLIPPIKAQEQLQVANQKQDQSP